MISGRTQLAVFKGISGEIQGRTLARIPEEIIIPDATREAILGGIHQVILEDAQKTS